MTDLELRVCGIPCLVRVTHWVPWTPCRVTAEADDSYPEDGGYGDWEILDRNARPAPWLARKLTPGARAELEQEIFNHMENH
jgi:hypothetical protein